MDRSETFWAFQDLAQDWLPRLLQDTLGSNAALELCTIIKQDVDYRVLSARLRQPCLELVIKLAGLHAGRVSAFESLAHIHQALARHTDAPTAAVLAADDSCTRWPWRYLIQERAPGVTWAHLRSRLEADRLTDAFWQIGCAVAEMHRLCFPAFGDPDHAGKLKGETKDYFFALKQRAGHLLHVPRWRDYFLEVLDVHKSLFENVKEPRLCHDDLHGANILFSLQQGVWRLTALLDFDKAWAGHVESDLARLALWSKMNHSALWTAYQQVHVLDPGYIARRPIYQLLWCLEYGKETEDHLATTRAVSDLLGLPPIKRFRSST